MADTESSRYGGALEIGAVDGAGAARFGLDGDLRFDGWAEITGTVGVMGLWQNVDALAVVGQTGPRHRAEPSIRDRFGRQVEQHVDTARAISIRRSQSTSNQRMRCRPQGPRLADPCICRMVRCGMLSCVVVPPGHSSFSFRSCAA